MQQWNLVGEGEPEDTCGDPFPYHKFHNGHIVWGRKQCTRRACNVCADHRYLRDASDDLTRTIFGWVKERVEAGRLFDAEGRSLKIYHFIYSRRHNNLVRLRREARRDLQRAGLDTGYIVVHPYRGAHGDDDSPSEIRQKLDRSKLSLHLHGFAIGYWSEPIGDDDVYYHSKVIADIRSWEDPDIQIYTRGRMLAKAQYDIGHAGWYGNGQCITRFGKGALDPASIPGQPLIHIRYPIADEDGTWWWELRNKPEPDDWDEFHRIANEAVGCDARKLDSKSYIDELPKAGAFVGLTRYWSLDEVITDEYHGNWKSWRDEVARSVSNSPNR